MSKPSDTLARLRARSVEAGRYILPLDPLWAAKSHAAYAALRNAEMAADPDDSESSRRVAEAQAQVDEINAEAEGEVLVFKFRRLSRAQYDAVVTRNPPTAEQIEKDKDVPLGQHRVFNTETFPIDLLHTVLIEPVLPLDELTEIINGPGADSDEEPLLSKGEAEALMSAAMQTALSVPRGLPAQLKLP